jgi:methylmalonyl-CoA/ethylmalonyl-CoA epimerase
VLPTSPYETVVGDLLGGLVVNLDHIAICVRDIDEAARAWTALLGVALVDREDVIAQKTRVGFIRAASDDKTTAIELICPLEGNIGLNKFLDKRGDAIHHLAFAVTDIHAALERLAAAGVRLIDKTPRPGACGHTVAFVHPRAMGGTLLELVQH